MKKVVFTIFLVISLITFFVGAKINNRNPKIYKYYDLSNSDSTTYAFSEKNSYCIFRVLDENGNFIQGAKLQVCTEKGYCFAELETNEYGLAGFSGFLEDYYYIKQIETKENYNIDNNRYIIDCSNDAYWFNIHNYPVTTESVEGKDVKVEPEENCEKSKNTNNIYYSKFLISKLKDTEFKFIIGDAIEDDEKKYTMKCDIDIPNAKINEYTVTLNGTQSSYMKIVDSKNESEEKTQFSGNESFTIKSDTFSFSDKLKIDLDMEYNEENYKISLEQNFSIVKESYLRIYSLNEERSDKGIATYALKKGDLEEWRPLSTNTSAMYRQLLPGEYEIIKYKDKECSEVIDSKTIYIGNCMLYEIYF